MGGNSDGINNLVALNSDWSSLTGADAKTAGLARVRYNTKNGQIVDVDIAFNARDFTWSTTSTPSPGNVMDVQNVATHELGHGSGLGDLYNPLYSSETMYGLIPYRETGKRDLFTGDQAGIQYIYSHLPNEQIDLVLVFDGSE